MLKESNKSRAQPSEVMIPNWSLGKSAALCPTFTSLLNTDFLSKVSVTAVSAA